MPIFLKRQCDRTLEVFSERFGALIREVAVLEEGLDDREVGNVESMDHKERHEL